eukprot:TRINITY_DN4004_c0_g1_i5.p1 TRINITY_DN4004_c0_g1~~TRINITY_DN4004_c0_g1_i5.p1  ORF type:complete len:172 (+),score=22.73 TRINITY_DN4004_c0_g1_i5:70-585(+)
MIRQHGHDVRQNTNLILGLEFGDLDLHDFSGITDLIFTNPRSLFEFVVCITPLTGFYVKTRLRFRVQIPVGYPQVMPKVTAEPAIYHPNISGTGDVPLTSWWGRERGFIGIRRILAYLLVILRAPDVAHPVNFPATLLVESNVDQFIENVGRSLEGGLVDGTQYTKVTENV